MVSTFGVFKIDFNFVVLKTFLGNIKAHYFYFYCQLYVCIQLSIKNKKENDLKTRL